MPRPSFKTTVLSKRVSVYMDDVDNDDRDEVCCGG